MPSARPAVMPRAPLAACAARPAVMDGQGPDSAKERLGIQSLSLILVIRETGQLPQPGQLAQLVRRMFYIRKPPALFEHQSTPRANAVALRATPGSATRVMKIRLVALWHEFCNWKVSARAVRPGARGGAACCAHGSDV